MRRVTGYTLVELMIALTLGALMLGAVIEFMASNRRSYGLADDLSRIQENGRAAIDILVDDARHSGFAPADHPPVAVLPRACLHRPVPATLPCPGRAAPQPSDQFSVQYVAAASRSRDCTGLRLPGDAVIINHYRIDDIDGDGIRSLYCQGYSVSQAAFLSNPVPLVDGIDAMQVLYRVYYPASNRYAYRLFEQLRPQDIEHISAVTIALLVSNGLEKGSAERTPRRYQLLDPTLVNWPADSRLRRLFRTTIALNNQQSGALP